MEAKTISSKTFVNDFIVLWLAAGMIHCTGRLTNTFEGILSFVPLLLVFVYGCTPIIFLMACTIGFFTVGIRVLGGSNHSNLYVILNVVLCFRLLQQVIKERSWEVFIQRFAPLFRYGIAVVYFMTGFHKLNTDFFTPEVSCMSNFLNRFVNIVTYDVDFTFSEIEIFIFATLVIGLELFGGVFLLFKKTQWIGVLCAICLHIPLSLIIFYDFASVAFALLYLFFQYQHTENTFSCYKLQLPISKTVVYYVLINSVMGVIAYFVVKENHWKESYMFQNIRGLIFVFSVLCIEWQLLYKVIFKKQWQGVSMRLKGSPIQLIVLIFLFLFGMTSYLGLRTAGNFTMFSNLHTEFEKSNHFILKHQPLKIFTQQNDLVEIIYVHKKYRKVRRGMPRNGQKIPKLQFLKTIHFFHKKYPEDKVCMELQYEGVHYTYPNILDAPEWQVEHPWWLCLFSFRAVVASPKPCSW